MHLTTANLGYINQPFLFSSGQIGCFSPACLSFDTDLQGGSASIAEAIPSSHQFIISVELKTYDGYFNFLHLYGIIPDIRVETAAV